MMGRRISVTNKGKTMSRPKNETVAKYHREHFKAYRLSMRKVEDAELLDYIANSEIPVTELFRRAFHLYMEKENQK